MDKYEWLGALGLIYVLSCATFGGLDDCNSPDAQDAVRRLRELGVSIWTEDERSGADVDYTLQYNGVDIWRLAPIVSQLNGSARLIIPSRRVTDSNLTHLRSITNLRSLNCTGTSATAIAVGRVIAETSIVDVTANYIDLNRLSEVSDATDVRAGLARIKRFSGRRSFSFPGSLDFLQWCSNIECLDISGASIEALRPGVITRLAYSCPRLKVMHMDHTSITERDLASLLSDDSLHEISLRGATVRTASMAVPHSIVSSALQSLSIEDTNWDIDVYRRLVGSVSELRNLDASGSIGDNADLKRAVLMLPHLLSLDIAGASVSTGDFESMPSRRTLKKLVLANCRAIQSVDLRVFESFASLQELDLRATDVMPNAVAAVSWPRALRKITLSGTRERWAWIERYYPGIHVRLTK